MTRLEYLKKEVRKYNILTHLYIIGLIINIISVIFLSVHMMIYWFLHDSLTKIQILKYSFSKFWFLYLFIIIFTFYQREFESFSRICTRFTKQLKEEEKKINNLKDADDGLNEKSTNIK